MQRDIFESYQMDNDYIIYDDTPNMLFGDYCSENDNNEFSSKNDIYFDFKIETPSSSKKTDFDENNNKHRAEEDNNIIIDNNELNKSQVICISDMEIEEEIKHKNENPTTLKNSEKMKYTKFTPANMLRKTKHILLDNLLYFLNQTINQVYNYKNIKGFSFKHFKTLNQKEKSETNIQYNKDFLNKTIGEILSEKISKRLTNYPSDHNKKLVQSLLCDKNVNIQNLFKRLFSLTFFDYLQHFRGTKYFVELKGMVSLNQVLQKYSDEPNYMESLSYYFHNYDIIINTKRTRNSKKKKEN